MKKAILIFIGLGLLAGGSLWAGYTEDLQSQIDQARSTFKERPEFIYFRDMGVLARKADDAGLTDLTAKIIRKELLEPMNDFLQIRLEEINQLFASDPLKASRQISELYKFERFFEPSSNFLQTAAGQVLTTALLQERDRALQSLQTCSRESILIGMQAVRRTGLYVTKSAAEIKSLRELNLAIECCLSWKKELHYMREQPFENTYETGTLVEEGKLRMASSPNNLSEAQWTGEWIYSFTGLEGKGLGVSQAVMNYRKGEDEAKMTISASRVTSSGRMNFPVALAGEQRTLQIVGDAISPWASLYDIEMPLTGCRDEE